MKMKKLVLISALLVSGCINAQSYPYSQNFDANTNIPTGWSTGGFNVMGGHGNSVPNAIVSLLSSTHTADTLTTPMVGPLTSTSQLTLKYRITSTTSYPTQTVSLTAADQIIIQAYSPTYSFLGYTTVSTINTTSTPVLVSTTAYQNFVFNTSSAPASLVGDNFQLRIIHQGAQNYYLDIDDFSVQNATGIETNPANQTSFIVFPNPSNGNFTVWLKNYQDNNPVEVSIYNYLGQKVKTITEQSAVNKQIRVSSLGLEKGMYLVEVKSGTEVATSKIQID